ncbi:GNAT family N-acetyltransferase [Aeromicrobium sp. SMF47]|uniref:GNAT family N-acetyltransferase n=1 Tax=Aeromicrobium yanjiei TaxID=2662028 RepID=A0A5Q2MCY9_9ACTN|nr:MULTISPECIES: GNAT family N-acetyltransferase [Aeromicrobium]MRJ77950.1 GNAT family N-acetyltransferase [Aeromicrobium yanjiei]MRK02310.1 GNAT family N-acetyltransferase [Aeromicrobium sp. S22]QGG40967.1 GNAT family N-acetyltransferase [Aeromicrobium yanjiei]
MTTSVQDNPGDSRFEITVDGELAGFVDYRKDGDEYALPHTRVFSQFEGQGIGGRLITGALEEIAARGGSVLPYCPFVPKVIRDNPTFLDLVPVDQRATFGL